MFGLNMKVTALMLINIFVAHGKIYREDKYVRDSSHVESYHRLYSDDRSDVFDNVDSKLNFDVPNLEAELQLFPGFHDNTQNAEVPQVDMDVETGFPNVFPVENYMLDQDKYIPPNWYPGVMPRPRWFPAVNTEGRDEYPTGEPSRRDMKRKCQNIKGLPTPESGCCGVQMTRRPIDYPNKPSWPLYRGGRFSRSADRDILPDGMIRGGKATDLHEFPWMVRLSIKPVGDIGPEKYCGGTIISSRYVLTAAHCLYGEFSNLEQLTVYLSEYNSFTFPRDCNDQGCIINQKRKVEDVIMHPDFNKTVLQNDVALLRLSADTGYSDYIRPVCLANEDVSNLSEEPMIIAGWGLDGHKESKLKRSAIVDYVTDEKCLSEYSYKDESMFCSIGGNGEDICHGDSGGPLMVYVDGKFFLSGVVNGKRSQVECGSTLPSLFNNVFYHLEWIKSHVH